MAIVVIVGFGGAEDVQEHIPIWISFHFVQPWVCSVLACLFHISVSHVCCDEGTEITHYFLILYRSKPLQIWTKKVRAFLFPVTSSGNILVFECFRVRDCDKEHAHV